MQALDTVARCWKFLVTEVDSMDLKLEGMSAEARLLMLGIVPKLDDLAERCHGVGDSVLRMKQKIMAGTTAG